MLIPLLPQVRSIQRVLEKLYDDCINGKSTLLLVPEGIRPSDIWNLLREVLWQNTITFEEIQADSMVNSSNPISTLIDIFGVDIPINQPYTVQNLFHYASALPRVIHIDFLDMLNSSNTQSWLTLLQRWAQATQSWASLGRDRCCLCFIMPLSVAMELIPLTDLYLSVYWWWGFPSALEMRSLCRIYDETSPATHLSRWREHLIPALAGNDLALSEHLWQRLHLSQREVVQELQQYAAQRGWTAARLQEWGAKTLLLGLKEDGFGDLIAPPFQLVELWKRGVLCSTPEYGLEIHSAALAVMGRVEVIQHRLWRGQVVLLLPLIDHIRLAVCEHLTRVYGDDWPVRWHLPDSNEAEIAIRASPLACQIGYLLWLLENCTAFRGEHRARVLITQALYLRNRIAHYQPVDFNQFIELLRKKASVYAIAERYVP